MRDMKRIIALLGAGFALALSACGQSQNTASTAPPPPPPVDQAAEAAKARLAQEDANKKLLTSLYSGGGMHFDRLADDYQPHDPSMVRFSELNHQPPKEAFKLLASTMMKLHAFTLPKGPQPPPGNMTYRIMADGDLVAVIHQRYLPVPGKPGMFYEAFSFDLWQIKDGKIWKQWDDETLPTPLPAYLKVPVKDLKFPAQKKTGSP